MRLPSALLHMHSVCTLSFFDDNTSITPSTSHLVPGSASFASSSCSSPTIPFHFRVEPPFSMSTFNKAVDCSPSNLSPSTGNLQQARPFLDHSYIVPAELGVVFSAPAEYRRARFFCGHPDSIRGREVGVLISFISVGSRIDSA